MTASHYGVLTAGVFHGLIFCGLAAYSWVGQSYRENFRLDFSLTTGKADTGADAREPDENESAPEPDSVPAPQNDAGTATNPGNAAGQSGESYARTNFRGVSGLIQANLYYPRLARQNNWQGTVTILLWVHPDGSVRDVSIRKGSGHSLLDDTALEAVRSLSDLPRPPLPVSLTVPVHFHLKAEN